jgi:hypothetical protein
MVKTVVPTCPLVIMTVDGAAVSVNVGVGGTTVSVAAGDVEPL